MTDKYIMSRVRILSYDCADRSLAVCWANVDTAIRRRILQIYSTYICHGKCHTYDDNEQLARIRQLAMDLNTVLDDWIRIRKLSVYDNTKGLKTDIVIRSQALIDCLKTVDSYIDDRGGIDYVLVEYQMPQNIKSRAVMVQIVMWYLAKGYKVYVPGPSLKNKIYFAPHLIHQNFMEQASRPYEANKNHCKANMTHWLKIYGLEKFLVGVATKNYDDLADSFMQIHGWLYCNDNCPVATY